MARKAAFPLSSGWPEAGRGVNGHVAGGGGGGCFVWWVVVPGSWRGSGVIFLWRVREGRETEAHEVEQKKACVVVEDFGSAVVWL
jgi:hypothetical protein